MGGGMIGVGVGLIGLALCALLLAATRAPDLDSDTETRLEPIDQRVPRVADARRPLLPTDLRPEFRPLIVPDCAANEPVTHQEMGPKRGAGLSRARIDLVNRFTAEAHGPPPRAAMRFWIGGEWVEMASSEPGEPPRPAGTTAPRADTA
jgi:hypothetical protein